MEDCSEDESIYITQASTKKQNLSVKEAVELAAFIEKEEAKETDRDTKSAEHVTNSVMFEGAVYSQVNEFSTTSLYLKSVGAKCALKGHVIEKCSVTSRVECGLKCASLLPDCKSLNYVTIDPGQSAICEINNISKSHAHKDDFVPQLNSKYFEPITDENRDENQGSTSNSFTDGPWTLVARFSNNDTKNWMEDNGTWWYDRVEAYGNTLDPSDNADMISEAFWLQQGSEFKITKSDDPTHTALLTTTGNCLDGMIFRDKMKSYGIFRGGDAWGSDQCLGNCSVSYGGNYTSVEGFAQSQCDRNGEIQSKNNIGFWCDYDTGDGAVLMIGGGGSGCGRADHGIGITEADAAMFQSFERQYDFGNDADYTPTQLYSLNMWVRHG